MHLSPKVACTVFVRIVPAWGCDMWYRPLNKTLRIMKLVAILLLAGFLNVSAGGYSQKVSLRMHNMPLKEAFASLEKQTGFFFTYTNDILKDAGPVSIQVDNLPLPAALDSLLSGRPLTYVLKGRLIIIKSANPWSSADLNRNFVPIKGTVKGADGKPLAGINISVKGSIVGTVTDENGHFNINVASGSTLIISGVGYYSKDIRVIGESSLEITLEVKSSSLDTSVVTISTGYQSISKERATGSYDVIGQEVLSRRPVSNISTALQGVVSGMQAKENADGSVDFLIRGNSSLYVSAKPLIVVDGFPVVDSSFTSINPNDVLSVTVLKDAAAASIWGARSANGVIVITTKHAKAARLSVELNAFTRISKMVNLEQVLTQAQSSDQVAYERLAFKNEWFFNQYAGSFTDIVKPLTLAQELLFANRAGKISAGAMNTSLDSLAAISNRDQVRDLLMQRGILNQVNLSLSGGTERSKTYASLMYENNKAAFKKSGYNRMLLNFNNQYRAGNFLNFSLGAVLQYRKQEFSGAAISEIQSLSPYETLLNSDGNYSVNLKTYNREQMALLPLSKFPYQDWTYNLLREVRGRELTSENLNARLQAGMNLRIFKGLYFDSRLQYERQRLEYENYYGEETFEARNLVNQLVEYNNNTKDVTKAYLPKGGLLRSGTANDNAAFIVVPDITNTESFLIRNQLNYNTRFSDKHEITAIAGMEISKYRTTSRTNPWVFGYFPDKLQSSVPQYGYGSSVDQFKNFQGQNATVNGANTVFDWRMDKFVSFYGNASYTYNGRYTITGSLRSDASNFITDDPSLRWSPFWSAGAMWNMKQESFMQSAKIIDNLNLRFTYGKNGNAEKSTSTKSLLNIASSLNPNTGTITATVGDNGNPSLRWEQTVITNAGIDYSLFGNRLFGKIDLYNKRGRDIMGLIALPSVTGTTSQRFNNAGIINKGVEVELGVNVKLPGIPVKYTTSVTYAYNRNKITSLYNPALFAYLMLDRSNPAYVEGRPVGSVYSFTYLGMVNGIPQVAGPKGIPASFNDATLANRGLGLQFLNYEGTVIPPHTLGWLNNITVSDFNLLVLFVGKLGGKYRNPVFNYNTALGSSKKFVDKYVADVLAGDPTIPGFALPKETQLLAWESYAPYLSGLVESSSYIECKEITLEYNVPAQFMRKFSLNRLKLFAQTRDLGMVWHANKKGYNPDWLPGQYRPVTTYTFGLNLQF